MRREASLNQSVKLPFFFALLPYRTKIIFHCLQNKAILFLGKQKLYRHKDRCGKCGEEMI